MTSEMYSTIVFYYKEVILQNENLNNFRSCFMKNYIVHAF